MTLSVALPIILRTAGFAVFCYWLYRGVRFFSGRQPYRAVEKLREFFCGKIYPKTRRQLAFPLRAIRLDCAPFSQNASQSEKNACSCPQAWIDGEKEANSLYYWRTGQKVSRLAGEGNLGSWYGSEAWIRDVLACFFPIKCGYEANSPAQKIRSIKEETGRDCKDNIRKSCQDNAGRDVSGGISWEECSAVKEHLCWLMEHIEYFSFRTPEALELKQHMRRWYYSSRRPAVRAVWLYKQFYSFFSGNEILDTLGGTLWDVARQSPLGNRAEWETALSGIPCAVTGRSIRAYGGSEECWKNETHWKTRLTLAQTDAEQQIASALEKLDRLCRKEEAWYRRCGMTVPAALVSLLGLIALLFSGVYFFSLAGILLRGGGLTGVAASQPVSTLLGQNATLLLIAACLSLTASLLLQAPHMLLTLCAGGIWIFSQKRAFRQRQKQIGQVRLGMEKEGFSHYCEKLRLAAQQLSEQPWDVPENEDFTRHLLNRDGLKSMFQTVPLRNLRKSRDVALFCKKLEHFTLPSRPKILLFTFLLMALLMILTDGALF